MKKIFLTLALVTGMIASAQVRIGGTGTAVNSSAILELSSTTRGVLFPNVALTSTTAFAPLAAHVAGMTVYNTATAGDVTPGLYVNTGAAWVSLGSSSSSAALNVTAELTTSYTVSATDDILLVNFTTPGQTLTFPVTGIPIGKKYYISNKGNQNASLLPLPRETTFVNVAALSGGTYIYLGGSSYSLTTGY
jgi:hypothetical protein